jgi:DNA-binding CsgD family transcriptional regulator
VRQEPDRANPRILGCHNRAVTSVPAVRAELTRLLHRGLGVREFSLAAARAIRRAVPFDGVCVLTMDPATLLPTGEVVENGLPASTVPRMTQIELGEPDYNKFADLSRRRRPAASLSEATGGDLDRSLRHRELKRPNGFGDELRGALGTWGGITLLREAGRLDFAPADSDAVASLSRELVEGLRRAIVLSEPRAAGAGGEPGLLLLADDDTVETANPVASELLSELGHEGGPLPAVVRAVAARARAAAAGDGDLLASGRVRTRAGRWLSARGSVLGERAAVILETARAPELAPLIADAYGLTPRERALTQLVAQGLPTSEIAGRLHLAPYTVQDHLKSIFEKVGVGTRGELVARLYVDQP